jgi:multicomponent Na+:H+ antiporter subunit G
MQDFLSSLLMFLGAILMVIAGIGIVRMPDPFLRMSAATKSGTLGVALIMLATIIHFADLGIAARAVGIVVFIMLTTPVAAHMIARATYFTGVQLWSGTQIDELRERYNRVTHALESKPPDSRNDPLQ